MTTEQVQRLLKELLEAKRYEQQNIRELPAISTIGTIVKATLSYRAQRRRDEARKAARI